MTVEVLTPDELPADESTPGIVRKTVFQTENNAMVQSHVAGNTTSGWHHHGERHVYGYLVEGTAVLEYGPGGTERLELTAPGFVHIPPGTVHRDVNPAEEEQVVLINFVGSGPLVVNVDGPEAE